MLPSFASDTVTRVRPTWSRDARNNRVPDYGEGAGRLPVHGCDVQPGASPEVVADGSHQRAIRWTVFVPAGADVVESDAVEWEGTLYRVDGVPQRVKSPTGALSHVMFLLIDWK